MCEELLEIFSRKYNAIYQTTCYNLLSHLSHCFACSPSSFTFLLLLQIVIDFHLSHTRKRDERNHWHNQFNTQIHHQAARNCIQKLEKLSLLKHTKKILWAHLGWKLSSSITRIEENVELLLYVTASWSDKVLDDKCKEEKKCFNHRNMLVVLLMNRRWASMTCTCQFSSYVWWCRTAACWWSIQRAGKFVGMETTENKRYERQIWEIAKRAATTRTILSSKIVLGECLPGRRQ